MSRLLSLPSGPPHPNEDPPLPSPLCSAPTAPLLKSMRFDGDDNGVRRSSHPLPSWTTPTPRDQGEDGPAARATPSWRRQEIFRGGITRGHRPPGMEGNNGGSKPKGNCAPQARPPTQLSTPLSFWRPVAAPAPAAAVSPPKSPGGRGVAWRMGLGPWPLLSSPLQGRCRRDSRWGDGG